MKRMIPFLLACLMLMGCGAKIETTTEAKGTEATTAESSETTLSSPYLTLKAENGTVTIEKKNLSENVLYINYDCDGTMMQLLAGTASDGSFRVSLNTCQSCNPSPKAYFVQKDGKLICQNCGNKFTMDNLGEKAYGCNPTYIDCTQTEDAILVKEEDLKSFVSMFTNWKGITEA